MLQLIEAYAALGEHRTGSEADAATSQWICDWLAQHAIDARVAPFSVRTVSSRAALVTSGGSQIAGTPLFDGGATGPQGIEAPLVRAGGAADGAIILIDQTEPGEIEKLLAADGGDRPCGAIVVTGDPEGHVVLRNAERMARPFSLPVLQIAARDATGLSELAASRRPVRLIVDRDIVTCAASNVVVDLPVAGGEGLVVIMTPKSGWFSCAAERGGGIAIAMALAMHIVSMPRRRKHVRLLFTSGHELGHAGLLAYLEQNPQLRTQADFWLQLGASIGARNATGMRVFSRVDALREWFMPVLQRHAVGNVTLANRDLRPHGESREIFECPFVSLAGRHPYFHSPQDVAALSVDAQSVARYARAFAELLDKILG